MFRYRVNRRHGPGLFDRSILDPPELGPSRWVGASAEDNSAMEVDDEVSFKLLTWTID